jgi:putative Ca2+/H+ antiporter (TMEM165/GDT1 family)
MGGLFFAVTLLVAVAELGDKTQLLVLALACRYRWWQVMSGVTAAIVVLQLLAAGVGSLLGDALPRFWLQLAAGVLFIAFGVWTLLGKDHEEDEEEAARRKTRFGPALTSMLVFFLAELGDKTQLITATIAAEPAVALEPVYRVLPALRGVPPEGAAAFVAVWLGGVLGMVIADGASVAVGSFLGAKLPERAIKYVSAVVFVAFGVFTLWSAFFGG